MAGASAAVGVQGGPQGVLAAWGWTPRHFREPALWNIGVVGLRLESGTR